VEDKVASAKAEKFVGIDVDYVIITPAYGKDDVHKEVTSWKAELKAKLDQSLISQEDYTYYLGKYEAWKKGIEMPPDGTAIKTWGVLSPSQQKLLTSIGIHTVEDLAAVNDEGLKRIGMGSVELKRKANAWLAQLQDKGPLTQQMAALQAQNDELQIQVRTLAEKLTQAMALLPQAGETLETAGAPSITATDLLDDEPPKRGPGRPRKEG
jgi:hypothetical protein